MTTRQELLQKTLDENRDASAAGFDEGWYGGRAELARDLLDMPDPEAAVEEVLRTRFLRSMLIQDGRPVDVVPINDIRLALHDPHGSLATYRSQILHEAADDLANRLTTFAHAGAHIRAAWAISILRDKANQ